MRQKIFRLWFISFLGLAVFQSINAQQKPARATENPTAMATTITAPTATISSVSMTGAYAEVYASKVEAEADLKVLSMDLTEETTQVREKKLERDLLAREIRWLEALPSISHDKMTVALGRLLVRKTQAEVSLKMLSENYAESFPTVKKARTRIEVYNSEIQKLLQ
ncbi:MAG: hypothetical protein ABI954_02210 [Pyrinomonadaceae bacterium]